MMRSAKYEVFSKASPHRPSLISEFTHHSTSKPIFLGSIIAFHFKLVELLAFLLLTYLIKTY
jgi:hypothetical protein